jgi:surface polysaccharide O-acyltransferase-like enzyme
MRQSSLSLKNCFQLSKQTRPPLLLDPSKEETISFYLAKRSKRILLPLFFWSCVYFIFLKLRGHEITARFVLTSFFNGGPYYHLYFLYLILGLYLITPALKIYLNHASPLNVHYCLAICFSFVILQKLFAFLQHEELPSPFAFTTYLSYIGYYIGGGYLRNVTLERKRIPPILVALFLCFLIILLGSDFLIKKFGISSHGYYLRNYLSPPEIVMVFCIYLLVRHMYAGKDKNDGNRGLLFKSLAPVSFGTYLLHPMIVAILNTAGINGIWKNALIGIPVTTILTLIACFTVVSFMRKVPLLRLTV